MPHDKHGNLLGVGDTVVVECKVTSVSPGNEYCNITVETVEKMYPGDYVTQLTFNSKQVVKLPVQEGS